MRTMITLAILLGLAACAAAQPADTWDFEGLANGPLYTYDSGVLFSVNTTGGAQPLGQVIDAAGNRALEVAPGASGIELLLYHSGTVPAVPYLAAAVQFDITLYDNNAVTLYASHTDFAGYEIGQSGTYSVSVPGGVQYLALYYPSIPGSGFSIDNVEFYAPGDVVDNQDSSWGEVKALFR
jgi:hypothetical protein